MRFPSFPHCVRLVWSLLLPALMCALPVNAVMASVGEMHELAHQDYLHAHGGDAHPSSGGHAGQGDAGRDEGGENGSFLHALMHASHCCVAQPAIVPSLVLPVPAAVAAGLHRCHDAPPGRRPASTPFRPPIAA